MSTLNDLQSKLKSFSKQVKYAQARALTKVARQMQADEQANIESTFDNPTPFTVNSVKSFGARRDDLRAKVFIQSIAASYLDPYENGGIRKLSGNALLNPKGVALNKYGNLARNKTSTLTAKPNVFVGTVKTSRGDVRGIWQRKATARRRRTVSRKQTSQLKLLIRFGDALPVKQELGFYDVAQKTVSQHLQLAMQEAIREVFEMAK
ncbi:hypothetical protein CUZ56_00754 [Saezia sanguinis]|uniref:Prophage minor tail protein Z (GPZ) n=1 Tax=Saezia sanguinis TaxID=1965230 RepID=A0A433SHR9_9BURK|nr:hypothetical protein [Saezia sanguinis]RUS68266.1 hypothetical protein CUZ56_00754 [Saezia sanguinis]